MLKKLHWIALPLLFSVVAFVVAACVTVNVNLPEGAVQQASDDYVKQLYDAKEKGKPSPEPSISPEAKPQSFLDYFEATALADGAVKVDSETISQIRDRQLARLDSINALKSAGVLGETGDGLLDLRNKPKAKSLPDLKKTEKLLGDENTDRKMLYEDIVKQNGISKSNLKGIQRSFSRSFQDHSPKGTWIQDEDGNWAQKP